MIVSPVVIVAWAAASSAGTAVAPSIHADASCGACHETIARAHDSSTEAHQDLECVDCHSQFPFNPHVAPDVDDGQLEAAHFFERFTGTAPAALVACEDCHGEETVAWRESIHGQPAEPGTDIQTPTCVQCHGPIHNITEDGQGKLPMAERCISCHAFRDQFGNASNVHIIDTYRETVHGKMLRLGNERGAACADCHSGHGVFGADDPRSTVHLSRRTATCAACHEGATDSFAGAISHEPPTIDRAFWQRVTIVAFSALTLGVMLLLFLHVVLDLYRSAIQGLRGEVAPTHPSGAIDADATVERLDLHARIQHWIMIGSFVTLVITGWPLKSASVDASIRLSQALGGQAVLALVHRIAGAILIADFVYHLAYLAVRIKRHGASLALLPGLKDFRDVVGNVAYFVGLRSEKPRFGRWTYYEKFDYWAVFWGMLIMAGSGLALWFPEAFATFLPGSLLSVLLIAHSDEAVLAALAIFLWHFYNVHLRPTVFPMSWVWLTGKISAAALYDDHRQEYEHLYGKSPPAPASEPARWHGRPIWSFVAVLAILVASVGVVLADVSSIRSELAALSEAVDAPEHSTRDAAAGTGSVTRPEPEAHADLRARCFACHNEARFNASEGGFPHTPHFEDEDVDAECAGCHQLKPHRDIITSTTLCFDCHEAGEVGLPMETGQDDLKTPAEGAALPKRTTQ